MISTKMVANLRKLARDEFASIFLCFFSCYGHRWPRLTLISLVVVYGIETFSSLDTINLIDDPMWPFE